MLQYIATLGNDLLILLYGSVAVADAEDREHTKEGEHLLQEGLAEDVGASHEDGGAIHSTQDNQRVEQCTGMVASDDYCSIFRQVLLASDRQTSY